MKKPTLLLMLLLPIVAGAQTTSQKADELLIAYTTQHKFSGNILIAKKGEIIFKKSYGYADLENHRPNTLATEFRVASLTKMFTSTVILQLVEAGKIRLTDPVIRYVPSFPEGEKITIKNLLSHTSGIAGDIDPKATDLATRIITFKAKPLAFTPGEKFEYNNFNFMLLSYIAQKVTGTPFPQLVKHNVLDKAQMANSGLDFNKRVSANKALGYVTNPATNEWVRTDGDVEVAGGAGGLYTTIGDLYKWAQAVAAHKILPVALYQLAVTPVQPGYGLGWIVNNNGHNMVGHTGSIQGFISAFLMYPKDDITIIYMSNTQDLDGGKLDADLTALVYNEPYQLPVQKQEIALPKNILERYVGVYELKDMKMNVLLEGGKLMAIAPFGDKIELTPEAVNKFFLKGPDVAIEFKEQGGKIKSMWVDMSGGQEFTRIN